MCRSSMIQPRKAQPALGQQHVYIHSSTQEGRRYLNKCMSTTASYAVCQRSCLLKQIPQHIIYKSQCNSQTTLRCNIKLTCMRCSSMSQPRKAQLSALPQNALVHNSSVSKPTTLRLRLTCKRRSSTTSPRSDGRRFNKEMSITTTRITVARL
jgi:hypothetical protein